MPNSESCVSKYDPKIHPVIARSFIASGYSQQKCADEMGISMTTLMNWRKVYPEFDDAIAHGQTTVIARVERALLDRALGFEYEEKSVETCENEDGTSTKTKVVTKSALPDVVAQKAFLAAYSPNRWGPSASVGVVLDDSGNTIEPPSIQITFKRAD